MRRASKVDSNQPEIVQALRNMGCSVTPTHQIGKGFQNKKAYIAARLEKASRHKIESLKDRAPWCCLQCGIEKRPTIHQMRQTYCSKDCMAKSYSKRMSGNKNPNFKAAGLRICKTCNTPFHTYQARKYCSHYCYTNAEDYVRGRAKKDSNHNLLVEAIQKAGGAVLDMHKVGGGVPDLIVNTKRGIQFAEIKNPESKSYSKQLTAAQQKWANNWRGAPVYILRTVEDAIALTRGDFEYLQSVGGWKGEL